MYPSEPTLDSHVSRVVQRVTGGYSGIVEITPSDTVDLASPVRGLMATTAAGLVSVVMSDGTTASVYAVLGALLPLIVTRVNLSGTAATGIVGFY